MLQENVRVEFFKIIKTRLQWRLIVNNNWNWLSTTTINTDCQQLKMLLTQPGNWALQLIIQNGLQTG